MAQTNAEKQAAYRARKKTTDLWDLWTADPAAARWTPLQEAQAERALALAEQLHAATHPREIRLLSRELVSAEGRLGLGRSVTRDEEVARPEPRDVALRVPDLGLIDVLPHVREEWPSLGPALVQWVEANLVYGPGDLRDEPARVSDEVLAWWTLAYQVFPRGHRHEGEWVWRERATARRKGSGKTEELAWQIVAHMSPSAPAIFAGWLDDGSPRGQGYTDPRCFLLTTTEHQASSTLFSAVLSIIKGSPTVTDQFRITDQFLMRADGSGVCEPCTASPNARDGALTTLNVYDETHRIAGRASEARDVMQANLPKRKGSYSLSGTTAWEPGQDSVAESDDRRAREEDGTLLYWYRGAKDGYDLKVEADVVAAAREASGEEVWAWTDERAVLQEWEAHKRDIQYFERVWLNRSVSSSTQAMPMQVILEARKPQELKRGQAASYALSGASRPKIVIGFDGSVTRDHTAMIGETVDGDPYQFVIGIWKPEGEPIDVALVDEALRDACRTYDVKMFLGDPSGWADQFSVWAGDRRIGKIVKAFKKDTGTPAALLNYIVAWESGGLTYDGDEQFTGELSNARRKALPGNFPDGTERFTIQKGGDRTRKIDGCMAGLIAHEARRLVIAKGKGKQQGASVASY
jgi:hypothetical protein